MNVRSIEDGRKIHLRPSYQVGFHAELSDMDERDDRRPRRRTALGGAEEVLLILFGVLGPAATLGIEASTGMCAADFFDPLPTLLHAALVALVPASVAAFLALRDPTPRQHFWLCLTNGAALAVAAFYSLLFLPIAPMALFAVLIGGLGLLPLSPFFALGAALVVRLRLIRSGRELGARGLGPTALGAVAAVALPILVGLPAIVTNFGLRRAASPDAETSERGVAMLREWGSDDELLAACYERTNTSGDLVSAALGLTGLVPPLAARPIYYRVTGRPFNATPPPERYSDAWGFAPRFGWDDALGTDRVAGRVGGLALSDSRLDATVEADAGLAYWEWTLAFHNASDWSREARTVVLLPPGGVVSRLTLWVDGEEREAAFAARGKAKEAYREVVETRRDPVLVTTAGPDRVLVQCFPVFPRGEMRVRFGITAPLAVREAGRALLAPPRFLERNFSVGRTAHATWVESRTAIVGSPEGFEASPSPRGDGGFVARGSLSDARLTDFGTRFELDRAAGAAVVWSEALDGAGGVRQRLESVAAAVPSRLAVVVDGSVSVGPHADAIADALAELPADLPVALWVAGDRVEQPISWEARGAIRADGLAALREFAFVGGRDSVPALQAALDATPLDEEVQLLWLHGPQPVTLHGTGALEQHLKRRALAVALHAVQVAPGPNEVLRALGGSSRVRVVPRVGALGEDLDPLVRAWSGVAAPAFVRERLGEPPPPGARVASTHLARLWAADRVRELLDSGTAEARTSAQALAVRHQLVTPVSGAVVLETAAQYEAAGLEPVDPDSVPTVPEPAFWALLAVGALALLLAGRAGRRAGAVAP